MKEEDKVTELAEANAKTVTFNGADKSEGANAKNTEISESQEKQVKKSLTQKIHSYLKENYCTETEVVGVEIQPDSVRICQAKQEKGKWQINNIASGNILNTNNYESLIKNKKVYVKTLKEVFRTNKILNKNIALSIPASMVIIKVISLPLMTEENLAKASKIESFWKNLVQLSGDAKDYAINYKIVAKYPKQKEMDVLFVASKNEDLQMFTDVAEDAELSVVVVDVGCFSINNLSKLREGGNKEETKVYLKIGKDENYLQVLEQNKPYIYDIFVPENEKAYLNEYLDHQTFQQRFTSQLKHVITKHEDKFQSEISKIEVISDEKEIASFTNSLNKNLDKIKIMPADLFEGIEVKESISKNEIFKENSSAWAVSAGLATRNIQIFEDENKKSISETINLLPDSFTIKEKLKANFYSKIFTSFLVIVTFLILMIFGGISYGKYQHNYATITEFNKLNKEYSQKQKIFKNISEDSAVLNKLVSLRKDLESNQDIIIKAFKEIATNIPEGVWLEEIKIDDKGEIIIEGRSFVEKTIIKFSRTFEGSRNITSVNIGSMKSVRTESGSAIKEFVINGKLKDSEGKE